MEVTSSTEPIVNNHKGQNIPVKDHKINVTQETGNLIMIYTESKKEAYKGKQ